MSPKQLACEILHLCVPANVGMCLTFGLPSVLWQVLFPLFFQQVCGHR